MDLSHIIAQPWMMPGVIGAGAFLLGVLVSRKSGSSWLGAVLFFLPHLLLDLLDIVHTKKFKYYGLILALLAIEAFFAFRAATVYYDVLHTRMPAAEMMLVCALVFTSVGLCGYMVATHGKLTFWSFCTMVFVIVHDWAGTIYMNYAGTTTSTTSAAPDDTLKLILTIGMCVLSILPFIMGSWAEELHPQLEAEQEEEVNEFTGEATRKIKRRAVDRVLRLANHTNVVHLVRALPADEFADFKQFVMPIIAPGTPYNLTEIEAQGATIPDTMGANATTSKPPKTRHQGSQKPVTQVANGPTPEMSIPGQTGSRKPATRVAENLPQEQPTYGQESSSDGSQKLISKTAKRDAKIRQYAATHPELTHAKLAARFHVSERTISRVFAAQYATPGEAVNQPSDMLRLAEVSDEKPAPNGHYKMQERETDKLEKVSVGEDNLVERFHQN